MATPQGFPLAYETMPGQHGPEVAIESRCRRSERVWIMDRGIPTEEMLAATCDDGCRTALEQPFPGAALARSAESIEMKLPPKDGEAYVLAHSRARVEKERSDAPAASAEALAAAG